MRGMRGQISQGGDSVKAQSTMTSEEEAAWEVAVQAGTLFPVGKARHPSMWSWRAYRCCEECHELWKAYEREYKRDLYSRAVRA